MRVLFILWLTFVVTGTCAQEGASGEFRGVWIATAYQIDWPKEGRMSAEQQREDFIEILDFYKGLNFNAVFVQVRAAGDAFYKSELAPWSRFLSGAEGSPGDPTTIGWDEDPLAFMVREAHARGMQLHAWLNPFRVTLGGDPQLLDDKHVMKRHPEWCIPYGRSYYLDPGLPEVQQHVSDIVAELVDQYAIDGIHFDDYFYPYPLRGQEFNDRASFVQHGLGDFQEREDWRRANVDSLVARVDQLLASKNEHLRFGVSPFGIWRNRSDDPSAPDIDRAVSTYDHLFANPLTWMEQGWVDYLVPQLYWSSNRGKADFRKLAIWWNEVAGDTPIYLGNGVYRWENDHPDIDEGLEFKQQLLLGRELSNVHGHVFFSARSLMARPDLVRQLQQEVYRDRVTITTGE